MALWMEAGSEPQTDTEVADLDAITALKESAALELKEKGNEYVKKGKKHYSDAIDCYTRAISQRALSDAEHSTLYSNRAHVNLLLGNNRRALQDAEEAIKLCPINVKVVICKSMLSSWHICLYMCLYKYMFSDIHWELHSYECFLFEVNILLLQALYRGVKASLSLNMLDEANTFCEKAIQQSPDNEELKKLAKQIEQRKLDREHHEAEVSKAVMAAKDLVSAFEERKLKMGKAMYQELTGLKKPILDNDNILHWPVLLLYAEVMSSDFIEDFCETDTFSIHLDAMFSESSPPLPWDSGHTYTHDALELYYETDSSVRLSKKEISWYLLEGTAAQLEKFDSEENDSAGKSTNGSGPRWVKVNEKRRLYDVLKEPNHVIPGIPVFFVVSKKSSFYNKFKSGNWDPPAVA